MYCLHFKILMKLITPPLRHMDSRQYTIYQLQNSAPLNKPFVTVAKVQTIEIQI